MSGPRQRVHCNASLASVGKPPEREIDILADPLGFVVTQRLEPGGSTSRTDLAERLSDISQDKSVLDTEQLQQSALGTRTADVSEGPDDMTPVLISFAAIEPGQELGQ